MIRITYDTLCDICQKHISTDIFNCTNQLGGYDFPKPKNNHTYQIGYSTAYEMCNECATPIVQARDEVMEKFREKVLKEKGHD